MADGKRWFKVWTSILTDPAFEDTHNQIIGAWMRLCALVALHGEGGKINISEAQFKTRCHLQRGTDLDINSIVKGLQQLHIKIDVLCDGPNYVTYSIEFENWHKYQVDSSAERTRKYRENMPDLVTVPEEKRREEKRRDKKRREKEEKNNPPTPLKGGVFTIPTIKEIALYCEERKNGIDANKFFDHYESKGWFIGKNKMKDWRAAVRTWEGNNGYQRGEQSIDRKAAKTPAGEGKYSGIGQVLDCD